MMTNETAIKMAQYIIKTALDAYDEGDIIVADEAMEVAYRITHEYKMPAYIMDEYNKVNEIIEENL